MKKYYSFGEIILTLREEYRKCKYLLDELNKYVKIEDKCKYCFNGQLAQSEPYYDNSVESDRLIKLFVEKKFLK